MLQTNLEKKSAKIYCINKLLVLQYIDVNMTPEIHVELMSSNAVYQASVK